MIKYNSNFTELDKLVETGHLAKKISDCGKYYLYNYSEKTVFEKLWDEHTLNSRGTVYEIATSKIVSRTLPKFFNLSELPLDKQTRILQQVDFEVFTKEDGSMGALSYYDNDWRFSTRGSFSSDQAIKARELLNNYNIAGLSKEITYIFEIIYPENRIVVDYGKEEKLVLLAAFHTETGREYLHNELLACCPFPIVESHKFNSIQEVIDYTSTLDANNEGFVIRLPSGERVKLKSPAYLAIARILTRMSPLVLWGSMENGKISTELMQSIPEEFRGDYEAMQASLEQSYSSILESIRSRYNQVLASLGINSKDDLPEDINSLRKPFALALQNDPNELNSVLFGVLLQKANQVDKFIMNKIRPKGNRLNDGD